MAFKYKEIVKRVIRSMEDFGVDYTLNKFKPCNVCLTKQGRTD